MHQITITGVPPDQHTVTDPLPSRREIHDLVKDRKQFSLYVQAIQKLFNRDQKELLSFFAIGGIHGLPYDTWDQSVGESTQKAGYCTHGSNIFPTWHRAYVALFEQELQRHASEIAKEYKENTAAWRDAALTLRSPYWDWAYYKTPPDEVIKMKTIEIITPNGTETIKNPLYEYTFHPIDPSFDSYFAHDPTTVRNPNPKDSKESQPQALIDSLKAYDSRTNVYKMMTLINQWPNFSNHTYNRQQGAVANSLEEIHDNIHDCVGGAGHMGDPAYAAFDPIFWMHHTQVDRLLALWQTIHYNVWVTAEHEKMQTYTIPPNSLISEDTDLTPFWNGRNTYWKSVSGAVKDWTKFNYDYPEFANLKGLNERQRRFAILVKVRTLYGPKFTSGPMEQVTNLAANVEAPVDTTNVERADMVDWFVRIRSGRFALGGSYTVLLFLGEPPASQAEWRTSPNLLGLHAVFVSSRASMCANCQSQKDNIDEGFVHITERLEQLGLLSKPEEEIETFVRESLRWRIQKIDADVVAADTVKDLEVAVMTVPLKWSAEDQTHILEEGTRPLHRNLLRGLPGGRGFVV